MASQKVKAASLTWPSSLLELMSDQVDGLGTFMEPRHYSSPNLKRNPCMRSPNPDKIYLGVNHQP